MRALIISIGFGVHYSRNKIKSPRRTNVGKVGNFLGFYITSCYRGVASSTCYPQPQTEAQGPVKDPIP